MKIHHPVLPPKKNRRWSANNDHGTSCWSATSSMAKVPELIFIRRALRSWWRTTGLGQWQWNQWNLTMVFFVCFCFHILYGILWFIHFIQNMIWVCLKMGDKLFLALENDGLNPFGWNRIPKLERTPNPKIWKPQSDWKIVNTLRWKTMETWIDNDCHLHFTSTCHWFHGVFEPLATDSKAKHISSISRRGFRCVFILETESLMGFQVVRQLLRPL